MKEVTINNNKNDKVKFEQAKEEVYIPPSD